MAAVIGGAIAGVGSIAGGLFSGITGSNAAKKASEAELSYLNKALSFQEGVYNTAQTNLSPWISGGQSALAQYMGGLGLGGGTGTSNLQNYWNQFTQTPYYTFPLAQATQSSGAGAAARGLNLSTGELGELSKLGAGYASSNWQNYMNALNSLSGLGAQSATNLGQIGGTIGQQVGQTSAQQASAAGTGITTSTGLLNQGISNAITGLTGSGSSYGSGSSGLLSNSNIGNLLSAFTGGNIGGYTGPYSFGPATGGSYSGNTFTGTF